MASNASATKMIRAPRGICSPLRPSGYPVPSQRSWWWSTQSATGSTPRLSSIRKPICGWRSSTSRSDSVSELERRDPVDHRLGGDHGRALVEARQEKREFVAAEPERLAALAQPPGDLREDAVARGMAEAVVDPLEVVDVDQAERQRLRVVLGSDELALQPLVEVAMVAEPGERIGEREPHRAQLAERRALVERD